MFKHRKPLVPGFTTSFLVSIVVVLVVAVMLLIAVVVTLLILEGAMLLITGVSEKLKRDSSAFKLSVSILLVFIFLTFLNGIYPSL